MDTGELALIEANRRILRVQLQESVRLLQPSPTMARFDARQALAKSDPLLAFAYFAEAVADGRAECDQCAGAQLATLAAAAREALIDAGQPVRRDDLYA